jgi:hypothetical protein
MPFSLRQLSKVGLLATGLIFAVTLTALAFSGRHWLLAFARPSAVGPGAQRPTDTPPDAEKRTIYQLALMPTGFVPPAFTCQEGKSLLVVDNRSGLEEMSLQLDREKDKDKDKVKIHDVKVNRKQLDWNKEFDLKAGTYTLSETGNPARTCVIHVLPKK